MEAEGISGTPDGDVEILKADETISKVDKHGYHIFQSQISTESRFIRGEFELFRVEYNNLVHVGMLLHPTESKFEFFTKFPIVEGVTTPEWIEDYKKQHEDEFSSLLDVLGLISAGASYQAALKMYREGK